MSVLVRYRTGQQLVYSLVCYSPREGMRVTFNGDRGRLEYYEFLRAPVNGRAKSVPSAPNDRPEHYIRVFPHFGADYTVPVALQPGGHGGADPLIMEQIFSDTPPDDPFGRSAGVEQGAASVLVGIAGNESIRTGMPVDINSMVELRPSARKLSELR